MHADPLARILATQALVVLDGALATELEDRGADLDDPLWSARLLLEQPDAIAALHLDYFRAGADVATSASYQASFEGFARRGLGAEDAAALMRRSVALAAEARERFWAQPANRVGRVRPLVTASVGPYGAMRADGSEYRGDYGLGIEALKDFHRPRLRVLVDSGADLLACETLPCLDEALALAELLRDEHPAARAWIAFSCRDAAHTHQGDPVAECARQLEAFPQVVAIGVNCTAPAHVAGLVASIAAHTTKTVLAYPNSGERYDAEGKCWHGGAHAQPFAEQAREWIAAGARAVGGCCRTTPEDIAALRRTVAPR